MRFAVFDGDYPQITENRPKEADFFRAEIHFCFPDYTARKNFTRNRAEMM